MRNQNQPLPPPLTSGDPRSGWVSHRRSGAPTNLGDSSVYPARSSVGPALKESSAGHLGESLVAEMVVKPETNVLNRRPLGVCWLVSSIALATLVLAGCSGKSSSQSSGGLTVEKVTVPRETRTYTVPSSSMEPTLHCGQAEPGCEADVPDRVEVATPAVKIKRGDVIAFKTPPLARERCGAGGIFIKRVIALPGETWSERNGDDYIGAKKLDESYVNAGRRDTESHPPIHLPAGDYFVEGDNRSASCDSRVWGPVPRENIIGQVTRVIRTE
jgi:signal peptidase I